VPGRADLARLIDRAGVRRYGGAPSPRPGGGAGMPKT
jgi:hypothetical protein